MRTLLPLLMLALLGCPAESVTGASEDCDALCEELVETCGYRAYPRFESCLQGCAWYEEQGADVPEELACVQDAACDTFLIIECEHEYGLEE